MNITFTLTPETSGVTQSGNYNISGTTSGGQLNGVLIANGVTRSQLTTGYTATSVNDNVTGGTITSTGEESGGVCTNQIFWLVNGGGVPSGKALILAQVIYNNIAGGDVITITNDTVGGATTNVTSVNGTVYGNNKFYVDDPAGSTVTFTVQKTSGNGGLSRDAGTVELRVNLNPVDSFSYNAGFAINDTVTGTILPGDFVVLEIWEG